MNSGQVQRRHSRTNVDAEVQMRRAGKLNFRVQVYDLSPDGCKAEIVDRPELHEQVWIKFDGLSAIEAEVCWVAGSKVGLKFVRPIHEAVFAALTQQMSR